MPNAGCVLSWNKLIARFLPAAAVAMLYRLYVCDICCLPNQGVSTVSLTKLGNAIESAVPPW